MKQLLPQLAVLIGTILFIMLKSGWSKQSRDLVIAALMTAFYLNQMTKF